MLFNALNCVICRIFYNFKSRDSNAFYLWVAKLNAVLSLCIIYRLHSGLCHLLFFKPRGTVGNVFEYFKNVSYNAVLYFCLKQGGAQGAVFCFASVCIYHEPQVDFILYILAVNLLTIINQ